MPTRATHAATPIEHMAHFAGELSDAAALGQAAGLQVLLAEMQALALLMPTPTEPRPATMTDSQIEAEFDNMPV